MQTLTIDGRTLSVADGTTVLRAALEAGISIPHLCWHPAFVPEGSCRLCLVEVEGLPKLELACSTIVREGMIVKTATPAVRESRRRVLEFLLAEHPVDCPICDKAGECKLQDYYADYGLTEGVFAEAKERRAKKVVLGERLILDRERCVLCTRCVRFLKDVTGTRELGVFERGVHSEVGILEGKPVATAYAGNLVDLCPVGAITDTAFRHKTRTWFLSARPSVCPLCARGCSIWIDYHPGFPRRPASAGVYRIRPRTDEAVNGPWICDRGRYGYLDLHRRRLPAIFWNRGGQRVEMSREKILTLLGEKVGSLATRHQGKGLGLVLNSNLTVEEFGVVRQTLLPRIPQARVWFADPPHGEDDGFLLRSERTVNRRGASGLGFDLAPLSLEDVARGLTILVVLSPFFGQAAPAAGVEKALASVETKALVSPVETGFEGLFDFVIPSALPSEKGGTFVDFQSRSRTLSPVFPPWGDAWAEGDFLSALAAEISRTS